MTITEEVRKDFSRTSKYGFHIGKSLESRHAVGGTQAALGVRNGKSQSPGNFQSWGSFTFYSKRQDSKVQSGTQSSPIPERRTS